MLRVYIACLAAYNSGYLHGEWYDLADYTDVDELTQDVKEMIEKSPAWDAEEWAIHDTDTNVRHLNIGEHGDLEYLMQLEQALQDASDPDAFAVWLDRLGDDLDEAMRTFPHAFKCFTDDLEEFAHEFYMDTDDLYAEIIRGDYRGWRPQINMNDFENFFDIIEADGGFYVFEELN